MKPPGPRVQIQELQVQNVDLIETELKRLVVSGVTMSGDLISRTAQLLDATPKDVRKVLHDMLASGSLVITSTWRLHVPGTATSVEASDDDKLRMIALEIRDLTHKIESLSPAIDLRTTMETRRLQGRICDAGIELSCLILSEKVVDGGA